jgi:hypothetical protein
LQAPPRTSVLISGGAEPFTTATDRVVIQAVHQPNPAIAMTATVTVTDTGSECQYVVQATTNS